MHTSKWWVQIYVWSGAKSSLLDYKPAQEHSFCPLAIPNILHDSDILNDWSHFTITMKKHWQKSPRAIEKILSYLNLNALDFRNKLAIAVSYILSSIVSELSESETESKQKLEDLKVLRCSPDLLNNVKIVQGHYSL